MERQTPPPVESPRVRTRAARLALAAVPGLAFLPVLAACASDAPRGGGAVEVRDSAGVRIVQSRAPAWREGEGWRIGAEPLVRVGRVDGPEAEQLYRVLGAVRLSDGAIAVANSGTGQVRWFDATGAHIASAGATGDGPGEFRTLTWIGRVGNDSIYAWDRQFRRLTVFHAGRLVRVATSEIPADQLFPTAVGALRDGSVLVIGGPTYVPPDGQPGVQRPPLPVWLLDRDGAVRASLGPFPGLAVDLRPATGSPSPAWVRTEVPFGPATVVAAAEDRIVVGDNSAYELRLLAPDGSPAAVVRRVDAVPRPVRPEDLAAKLESRLAALPDVEEIRAGIRAMFEQVPPPSAMPFFRAIRVDPNGNLWVRAYAPPQEPQTRWDVFDPDGRWLGGVDAPPGLEITEIGADYAVGIVRDEMDVEYVQVHALVKEDG